MAYVWVWFGRQMCGCAADQRDVHCYEVWGFRGNIRERCVVLQRFSVRCEVVCRWEMPSLVKIRFFNVLIVVDMVLAVRETVLPVVVLIKTWHG